MDEGESTETRSGSWSDDPPPLFAAGDLVAGRYRVLRFIARGGAAEVYEVEDQELGQRLALKALRRDPFRARAIERFKREINLARQVTHPNVCRIYEYGAHGDQVLFLTMELLEGQTLLERVRGGGPLWPAEALPLVRQMAAGLEAAHRAGVIHRDFKSGNVMLVHSDDVPGGARAVITDFGLARAAAEDDSTPRVTAHDALVGTPAYMAPEQVEGGPITPASDVYAFGVVLYEMMTGSYPFHGESSLATAVLRLKEDPPSPREQAPHLDERWERTILRCLKRNPHKRFTSLRDLVTALEPGTMLAETPESVSREGLSPFAGPRAWRGWLVAALAVLGLAAAGGWLWRSGHEAPRPATETAAEEVPAARPAIALLGFQNLSGREEDAWLSTALSEMLASEVAAGEEIRVVPGENVARVKLDLGLRDNGAPGSDVLHRVGEILGADLVVTGSYLVAGAGDGNQIRLDLRVRRPATGETLAQMSERGTETGVLDLVEAVGQALRAALGVAVLSRAEAEAVRASHPAGPESARLYAQGLERLRLYHARAALELLGAAAASDPDNPLIRSALSSAWATLGYRSRAAEEARRAFELAGSLSRRDRLWVEARYHEIAGDRDQAVANYALLWDFFPDHLEYGLQLAEAQIAVAGAEAALATVARLRELPPPSRGDPRIDLVEAEAARALAQYDRQRAMAAAAARKAADLGALQLEARAREIEAGACRDLGMHDQATAALEEAGGIYAAASNHGAEARTLIARAMIDRHQGRFDAARSLIEQALAVAREIGDQGSIQLALNTLAIMLRQQGRLSEALAIHEMELETYRQTGERRSEQVALTTRGVVERRMGDLDAARESFTRALELSREVGNRRSIAVNLNLLGEVLLRQGRLEEARRCFAEALEENEHTKDPRGRAYYVLALGDVDFAAADLAAARERYKQALAIRESLGETTNVAYSQLALALLAIEERRGREAAERAGAALDEFRAQEKPDDEAYALSVLARARLLQGEVAQAQAAIERAGALLEKSENREAKLRARLAGAEVDAAAGRAVEARRTLEEVRRSAIALGFVDLRLEVELLLGRLELAADPAAGAERLAAVAREASERGFRLLADKAAAGGSVQR